MHFAFLVKSFWEAQGQKSRFRFLYMTVLIDLFIRFVLLGTAK